MYNTFGDINFGSRADAFRQHITHVVVGTVLVTLKTLCPGRRKLHKMSPKSLVIIHHLERQFQVSGTFNHLIQTSIQVACGREIEFLRPVVFNYLSKQHLNACILAIPAESMHSSRGSTQSLTVGNDVVEVRIICSCFEQPRRSPQQLILKSDRPKRIDQQKFYLLFMDIHKLQR